MSQIKYEKNRFRLVLSCEKNWLKWVINDARTSSSSSLSLLVGCKQNSINPGAFSFFSLIAGITKTESSPPPSLETRNYSQENITG